MHYIISSVYARGGWTTTMTDEKFNYIQQKIFIRIF